MSLINVTNITVGNNVCPVTAPLVFQIEFECLEDLKNDVEWKIIYVTSDGTGYVEGDPHGVDVLECRDGEIVLDAVCLGPVYRGILEFEFRVAPPDFTRMHPNGILGMQAILVTASYCDQEFIRIGYYTNNCYDDPELRECPPDEPNIDKMVRCIIEQPRVTRFPIRWDTDTLLDHEGNDISCVIDDNPDNVSSDDDGDGDGDDEGDDDVDNGDGEEEEDNNDDDEEDGDDDTTNEVPDSPNDAEQSTNDGEAEEQQLSGGSVKRVICDVADPASDRDPKLHCASNIVTLPTCTSISDI